METFDSDAGLKHLKKGVAPIMACIGMPEQFKENPGEEQKIFDAEEQESPSLHNVDYYGNPTDLKKQKFKNAGDYSYVISTIDTADKVSRTYRNCTGLVVSGQDKETGENISFLSHQDPQYFLEEASDRRNTFVGDLRGRLKELKERCVPGTIDAVIVGGNYFKDVQKYKEQYIKSIGLLSQVVQQELGFEPTAITGPKTDSFLPGSDNIFYDNGHRRLYIMRPEVGKDSTKSFAPSKIKEHEKQW